MKINKIIWGFAALYILFSLFGIFTKFIYWGSSPTFIATSSLLFLGIWIIVLYDLLKNNVYNKVFWLISLFLIPMISVFFYLIKRNKMIRLGNKYKSYTIK